MAPYSKRCLSGSTNGRGIKVVAVATLGTVIHQAVAGTTDLDEIWIFGNCSTTSDVKLTLEMGGVTVPDDNIEVTLAAEDGLKCIVPGLVLQNGLIITAFAATANVIVLYGFVNRITV